MVDVVDSQVEVQDSVAEGVVNSNDKELSFVDNSFVISSAGTGKLGNAPLGSDIPAWLNEAITDRIASGTSSFADVLGDLNNYVRQLEVGVNQSIANIQNNYVSSAHYETDVVSRLGANQAAILNAVDTKVTDSEARSNSLYLQTSQFENNIAGIINNDSTLANKLGVLTTSTELNASNFTTADGKINANSALTEQGFTSAGLDPITGLVSANAGESALMTAVVGPVEAALLKQSGVSAGAFVEWDGTAAKLKVGVKYTSGTNVYLYYGGDWPDADNVIAAPNNRGWRLADPSKPLIESWAAGASSISRGPNGEVTGWSYSDGSTVDSEFVISASRFKVSNGTNGRTPFSIGTTGKIKMTADVEFAGLGINGGSTTISGSKITAGTIKSTTTTDPDSNGNVYSITEFDLTNGRLTVRDKAGNIRVKLGLL